MDDFANWLLADDPHQAFYAEGEPVSDEAAAEADTGLRCWCGREVVSTLNDDDANPTGWAHVGEP